LKSWSRRSRRNNSRRISQAVFQRSTKPEKNEWNAADKAAATVEQCGTVQLFVLETGEAQAQRPGNFGIRIYELLITYYEFYQKDQFVGSTESRRTIHCLFVSGRIRGVLAPVVTPFKADLSPDRERLIAHCQWLLSQKCGLAVFGTNSEANSLGWDERLRLLDALVLAGADPSRMMPGTGCCSMTETVSLTSQAVKHGCAGVLMLPPFYYKSVSEEGLYRYFSEVVQRVGDVRLKIYLYHIPPVAVVGITAGLVERLLSDYPGAFAGMKDSSGDWHNTKMFLDEFGKSGFDVFVGSESFLLANMRNGGLGTISATANVNPAAIHRLYAEWENADAQDQQAKLNVVREAFGRTGQMIAALKQAIAIDRSDPDWARLRPPLVELTAEQTRRLEAELKAVGFAIRDEG
jgi:4-hydroxy-tetrahydrodipicolinate synthase